MSLRKKIILSNILMVILPVLLILIVWTGYVNFNRGVYLKPINYSSEGSDRLTDAINILYTYEAELSGMNWDVVPFGNGTETEVVVSPEKERIRELESLGYHLQAESAGGVSFSNLDEEDRDVLVESAGGVSFSNLDEEDRDALAKAAAGGTLVWSGSSLVIRDSFRISGQTWYLTAVYNEKRVDHGVRASLVPMYMVSPALLFALLIISAGCVALTSAIVSRWMGKMILVPLRELKKGADMVAKDDLDYRIPYDSRDEFGDVCEAFDHMRVQLREAEKNQRQYEEERRELLRGISHDLRSPLTSIKGYALGLKDGIADTEEKKERYYDAILTRAEDLERLTGSLSLLVRLESDNSFIHTEKVCLDEYIRQLLGEKESWLADRRVDVHYTTEAADAEVRLDIREMQRVFMNLFENTVRYRTQECSQVELVVLKKKNKVEIRFADDGPGVGPEHLGHIFESFYRADEARTQPGKGSGIGLAVVKRIVEGQGGQVTASSENGLCVTMVLPLANEAAVKDGDVPDSERGSANEKNTDC